MLCCTQKIKSVNSIHPGYIWTPLLENIANQSDKNPEEFKTKLNRLQPIGHPGEPADVAYAVLYLASDESKFVTASELVVDGGLTGGRSNGFNF